MLYFQYFHSRKELSGELLKASEYTKKTVEDSGNQFKLFDDEYLLDIIRFSFGDELYQAFKDNKIPASRSDIARLVICYIFGGVYLDISIQLDDISSIDITGDVAVLVRDDLERYSNDPSAAHYANGIIVSPPRSEFIRQAIDDIIINYREGRYNHDVINCTGPGVLTKIIKNSQYCHKVRKISFSNVLSKNKYVRVSGVSNRWLNMQKSGIYKKNLASSAPIFIHCGWPKVGSTSIQDTFRSHGFSNIIYPCSGRPDNARAHHQLVSHNFSGRVAENFKCEVDKCSPIVISSEMISVKIEEENFIESFNTFIEDLNRPIHIYIYLKNLYRFLESAYCQAVVVGFFNIVEDKYEGGLEDFVNEFVISDKSHLLKYNATLTLIRKHLKASKVVVREDKNLSHRDCARDFLFSVLGDDNLDEKFIVKSNVSIGHFEMALMIFLRRRGVFTDVYYEENISKLRDDAATFNEGKYIKEFSFDGNERLINMVSEYVASDIENSSAGLDQSILFDFTPKYSNIKDAVSLEQVFRQFDRLGIK